MTRVGLAVIVGLGVSLLTGSAFARKPAPPPCGGSAAAARTWTARIVREAQRPFPRSKLRATSVCVCYHDCRRKVVEASSFDWLDSKSNVFFQITPVAVHSSRPAANDDPLAGLREGESKKKGRAFRLEPFADPAEAAVVGAKIRRHPMVTALVKHARVYCGTDVSPWGAGASYHCSSSASEIPRNAPLPRDGYARHVEIRLSDGDRAPAAELTLTGYAAPSNQLPEEAPGWVIAREEPAVARFVAAHGTVRVELHSGRRWVLVVRGRPGSANGLVVKFHARERAGSPPLVIESVSRGTSP